MSTNRVTGLLLGSMLALATLPVAAERPTTLEKPVAAPTRTPAAKAWLDDVAAISGHATSDGRRAVLHGQLVAAGFAPREAAFTSKELQGANLIADVSGDRQAPLLLLGAHFDQVDKGKGVTDNASGSAVVLALARRFRDRPLLHHRVAAAFWDLEERGLLGAASYVQEGGEQPALYVNFDVFGWGDALWMMTPDDAHPLALASATTAQAAGLRFSGGAQYPPTDHLAFLKAGWPAVSYSLVGHDEIAGILDLYARREPAATPKVMQVIHGDGDTIDQVDAEAVVKAIDAVEAALRAWDARHGD